MKHRRGGTTERGEKLFTLRCFLGRAGWVRAMASPATAQAQEQVGKQQSAALHRAPVDHAETIFCHQVTPRPEGAAAHRLQRLGQERNPPVYPMSRPSLGTVARLLTSFKDRKLLRRLAGSSDLHLLNPPKNGFLAYAFAKRNFSTERSLWLHPCLEYAV